MKLDKRLSEIMSHISGQSFADIGCDHGKLAIKALQSGVATKVIATDISAPSLDKTLKLAKDSNMSSSLECRVGDGLSVVESGEVDTVVIAGLGGDEISRILENTATEKKEFKRFVLSPNTRAEKVRKKAIEQGFGFVRDYLVSCGNKFYTVIVLEKEAQKTELTKRQIQFGVEYYKCADFKRWAKKELSRIEISMKNSTNTQQLEAMYQQLKGAYEDNYCE